MFHVYIIQNTSGQIYIGQSCNLKKRLARHNGELPSKKTSFTRGRGPWKIVYSEEYSSRQEAKGREKFFKTGMGRVFIKNMLSGRSATADS